MKSWGPWKYTIDISEIWKKVNQDPPEITLTEYVTRLVEKIKTLPQWKEEPKTANEQYLFDTVHELTNLIEDASDDFDWYDEIMDIFYDWCDYNRVLVNLH